MSMPNPLVVVAVQRCRRPQRVAISRSWRGCLPRKPMSMPNPLVVVAVQRCRRPQRVATSKADVNAEPAGSGGRTALQAASEGGHLEVVERLLASKADVNAGPTYP